MWQTDKYDRLILWQTSRKKKDLVLRVKKISSLKMQLCKLENLMVKSLKYEHRIAGILHFKTLIVR